MEEKAASIQNLCKLKSLTSDSKYDKSADGDLY